MRNGRIIATIGQHPEPIIMKGATAPNQLTPVDQIIYKSFGKNITLSLSNPANPFSPHFSVPASKAAVLFAINSLVTMQAVKKLIAYSP